MHATGVSRPDWSRGERGARSSSVIRYCRNVSGVRRDGEDEGERRGERARKTRWHRCNTIATVCPLLLGRMNAGTTSGRGVDGCASRSIRAPSTRRRCSILPTLVSYPLSFLFLSLSPSLPLPLSPFLFITRRDYPSASSSVSSRCIPRSESSSMPITKQPIYPTLYRSKTYARLAVFAIYYLTSGALMRIIDTSRIGNALPAIA